MSTAWVTVLAALVGGGIALAGTVLAARAQARSQLALQREQLLADARAAAPQDARNQRDQRAARFRAAYEGFFAAVLTAQPVSEDTFIDRVAMLLGMLALEPGVRTEGTAAAEVNTCFSTLLEQLTALRDRGRSPEPATEGRAAIIETLWQAQRATRRHVMSIEQSLQESP
jgi:hypothetical protein